MLLVRDAAEEVGVVGGERRPIGGREAYEMLGIFRLTLLY